MKKLELTGQRFERLIVLCEKSTKHGKSRWLCMCSCGKTKSILGSNLIRHKTKSCGCISSEQTTARNFKHGLSNSPEHKTWMRMHERCNNKDDIHYGGRGITVCIRWSDFKLFLEDMGKRPGSKHSIERIDNNGNYEPGNCRWATMLDQASNKRSNHKISIGQTTLTIAQWSRKIGIPANQIRTRLCRGFSEIDAVMKPRKSRDA